MAEGFTSSAGIPVMAAIEDVEAYLKKEGVTIEDAIKDVEEKYRRYKYVESSMLSQRIRLAEKLPEFQSSLAILEVLIDKKAKGESFETTYLMAEEVYAKAVVSNPEKVAVWLGANVMVEFELDKAKELLTKNRDTIQLNVTELAKELDYIKDQITTSEVNMAHIYNYGVKKRQAPASSA